MDLGRRGIRALAVARTNDDGKWQMLGILTFLDPPRPDTKDTIERAMKFGVDVKMITGEAVLGREVVVCGCLVCVMAVSQGRRCIAVSFASNSGTSGASWGDGCCSTAHDNSVSVCMEQGCTVAAEQLPAFG